MIQKPQISPTSAAKKKRLVQFFNPFTEPKNPVIQKHMQTAAPKHNQTKIKDADTIINTTNFTIPEERNQMTARERERERDRI